jgi:spore germination cell wall hydrolase CwlJ-like protein
MNKQEYQKHIDSLNDLPEYDLLGRMIWGEARGQPLKGMVAVANIPINRLKDHRKRFGSLLHTVILRPYAFSCFNRNDPNLTKLVNNPGKPIGLCRNIARLALDGLLKDPTNGATHYFNPKVVSPFSTGSWNRVFMSFRGDIGNHQFYLEL